MKRILLTVTAAMLVLSVITGCSAGDTKTVSTDGSTSMEKVIGYLREVYMEENNDVKITFNPTGSGAGIRAVEEGRCDIGLSSRALSDDEKKNLNQTVIAIDGIAVIINKENDIDDLSVDEIAQLYTGAVKNWSELGGRDAPVVAIGREAASGTRDGFETATNTAGRCRYSQELTSAGDVMQTVLSNPNAIGYTSVAAVNETVKTVSVDGVMPDKASIHSGAYKIQRDFTFVTKKDKPLSEPAQDFFGFVLSDAATQWIEKAME